MTLHSNEWLIVFAGPKLFASTWLQNRSTAARFPVNFLDSSSVLRDQETTRTTWRWVHQHSAFLDLIAPAAYSALGYQLCSWGTAIVKTQPLWIYSRSSTGFQCSSPGFQYGTWTEIRRRIRSGQCVYGLLSGAGSDLGRILLDALLKPRRQHGVGACRHQTL